MSERPTPETDAEYKEANDYEPSAFVEPLAKFLAVERERDEAREAFIEARKHREQLNSLLASYTACWDEIKTALGGPEEGDQTCDLDRVLKAIRERDDYKWQLHIAKGEIAEARKMERAWKKEETK